MNFAVDDTPFLMFTMLTSDLVAAIHSCCKMQVITPALGLREEAKNRFSRWPLTAILYLGSAQF